jgi:hypothetical protein
MGEGKSTTRLAALRRSLALPVCPEENFFGVFVF